MSQAGMKRSMSDESGGNFKRQKNDQDVTFRLLLQSKHAGGIIGKGGQTIKRLRSEYKATVNVPDSSTGERILSIQATEENALNIVEESLQFCGPAPYAVGINPAKEAEYEINFLVHSSQVGSVIGRAGFRVKEIREKSGAQLKIHADCLPCSTERIIAIGGSGEQVIAALKAILDILAETPIKGAVMLYDPASAPNDFGGPMYPPYGGMPPRGGFRGGRGGPRGGGRGGQSFRGGAPFGGPPRGGGNMGALGGAPDGGNFSQGGEKGFEFDEAVQTTQVTIPKDLAGAVIGKGGERIRNIRQRSGADIKIDEPLPSQNDRIITITGTQTQINYAQFLMQQSVRAYSGKSF